MWSVYSTPSLLRSWNSVSLVRLFLHLSSSNQAFSNAYPTYFIVILDLNVATSVRATLPQNLQFDTDDHIEDDLPLRSRVLALSSSFMRMERGPT